MTNFAARSRSRLVASAAAVAVIVTAAALAAWWWALSDTSASRLVPALLFVDFGAFTLMGAVVALARPANRVGWFLLGGGTVSALGSALIGLASRQLVYGEHVPGVSAWAAAGAGCRGLGWYLATIGVPMFFPDGQLADSCWRWLPRAGLATGVTSVLGSVFATHAQTEEFTRWHNPLAPHWVNALADPISGLSLLLAAVTAIGCIVQLITRWRGGDTLARQRIGAFAAAVALPLLAAPLSVAGLGGGWLFAVTLLPLPFVVAYAVLARGLYDLATAANRSLVWLTLSAVVVAIYALVIAGVGSILDRRGAAWLPAVAAAVVALSFAPLRDALQRGVNRLMFGRWDDPYEILAALGQHLQASADVGRLLADVATELETTLRLAGVAIRDQQGNLLAGAPGDPTPSAELPLVAYGERVGTLSYSSAVPLRSADQTVLDDLAGHIGGLLHAHRIGHDLRVARERLVLATEEERRRLRRDLHDGLGPALAGHLLRVDVAARAAEPGSAAQQSLIELQREMQSTMSDLRRVVEGLRPPALDELGLTGAVQQVVHRLTAGTAVRVELEVAPLPQLPAAVEVAAFRIVSEAVTNVVKHAGATRCRIAIDGSRRCLQIRVEDDGRGGRPRSGSGHGLETMRERAEELGGALLVTASEGTTVCANLPLERTAG